MVLIIFIFIFGAFSFTPVDSANNVSEWLKRGLEAEKQGRYLDALEIWETAADKLETSSFALGREYIRLATANLMKNKYEKACEIYLWGLTGEHDTVEVKSLKIEISYISPLIERKEAKEWRNLLNEDPQKMYSKIYNFWASLDPTPASEYNERLIEHWERIAFAKNSFNRTNQEPYGTDDRGKIYVRYGIPDHQKEGVVNFDQLMVEQWVQEILSRQSLNPAFYYSRSSEAQSQIARIVRSLRLSHNYPEYEVWVYRNRAKGTNENTLFIFGTDAQSGIFGQVNTADELIPSRSLSGIEGITKQLNLYNQLSTVDDFFGIRLVRMEQDALTPGKVALLSKQKAFEHRNDLLEVERRSPIQESQYVRQMMSIPLDVNQYRLLDTDNKPYLATILQIQPQEALKVDYHANYGNSGIGDLENLDPVPYSTEEINSMDRYTMLCQYQVFSESRDKMSDGKSICPIVTSEGEIATGYMKIPHTGEGHNQVFVSELLNYDRNSEYIFPSLPFKKELRGLGRAEMEQPIPLNTDDNILEMGDLIVGYDRRDVDSDRISSLPFTIANDQIIPIGRELMVHVEVYHLKNQQQSNKKFNLTYEILPVNVLGWTQEKKRELRLSLQMETDKTYFRDNLEIKTEILKPGKYVLRMNAEEPSTGRTAYREIHFNIADQQPENN